MTARARNHPKYSRISEEIRKSILSGTFAPGARLPTEAQLVEQYKASRSTIIRALQDLENEGLLSRRQGSGSFATPRNAPASTDRRLFGLIIPGVSRERQLYSVFPAVTEALSTFVHDAGGGLIFGSRSDSGEGAAASRMVAVSEQMVGLNVNGIFMVPQHFTGPGREANRRAMQMLADRNVPVILLDRDIVDFPQRSSYDLVGVDNHNGGYQLGHHLIEQGCKRLIFLSSSQPTSTITARSQGVELAITEAGLTPLPHWRFTSLPITDELLQQVLKEAKPDAIVCGNDSDAGATITSLRSLGRSVPDDIAVAGFDDAPVAPLLPVPLTTIRQSVNAIAKTAVRLMTDRLEQPDLPARHVLVGCSLVVRASSKRT